MEDILESLDLLEMKAESFEIFAMGWLGRLTLGSVLSLSLLVTTFVHVSFMRFILFHAPKKRPINILIMIDQVCTLGLGEKNLMKEYTASNA